ncbi:MAG: hypothetical protein QW589_00835 [Candidatus Bathyarchaeia archaeon]
MSIEPQCTSWKLYDAFTEDLIFELVDTTTNRKAAPTGGATVFKPNEELLVYILSGLSLIVFLYSGVRV